MNCSDVCVWHEYVGGDNDFYSEREVTARKSHTCVECGEEIEPGQRYVYSRGKNTDGFFDARTCLICVDVRNAFVCGVAVFGMLWESIYEELYPRWRNEGLFECMAKLTMPASRAYCQSRFDAWEADRAA